MEWLQYDSPTPQRQRRRRLALTVLAVVAAIAMAVSISVQQLRADRERSADSPSRARTPPARPTPTPIESSPRSWRAEPFLTEFDLDLFAVDAHTLYRIHTGQQTITATAIANTAVEGPLGLVAGPTEVVVTNYDPNPTAAGNLVPDGRPSGPLPGLLAHARQILPGPDGQLWAGVWDAGQPRFVRTDFTGRELTSDLEPAAWDGFTIFAGDGAGGLIFPGADGTYQVTRHGTRRITRGTVVAAGPHHFMITDCKTAHGCGTYVHDRDTGRQRRLGPDRIRHDAAGTVSTDGRYAAVRTWPVNDRQAFIVLDLRTGAVITKEVEAATSHVDTSELIWLPDDRLVYVRQGTLRVYDPVTGTSTTPDLKLSGLTHVTMRS